MGKKKILVQAVLGLVLVFSLSIFGYSALGYNWRECLAAPGCTCTLQGAQGAQGAQGSTGTTGTQGITAILKAYTVDSAGNFFDSSANYLDFLYQVEMSDLKGGCSNEMKSAFYKALDSMKKARAAYAKVKRASKNIPFDPVMMERLQRFDYDGFQVKNELWKTTFDKVKGFLVTGDIDGLDDAVLANMDRVLGLLNRQKDSIRKGKLPDIQLLWRANDAYAESHLFGQYISQIISTNL